MGRLWDYLITDDWEATHRIQVMKAKARMFDSISDLADDVDFEEFEDD
jgi:hypothetical protein